MIMSCFLWGEELLYMVQPGDWVITTGYDNFGEAEELILK